MASLVTVEFLRCGVVVFLQFLQQKRKVADSHSVSSRSPKLMSASLSITCTLLVTLFIATSFAEPASPRRVEITAKRFAFEPAEITVKKGEAVELEVTSADVPHGLRIRELKIDLRVSRGKNAETTFTPQAAGTFVGHCSVFCGSGHGEMTLTIHVVA